MCNFEKSNFYVLHATKYSYIVPGIFFKCNTLCNICCDKGKTVDIMKKVRYQHQNFICGSTISRPDEV